MGIASCADPADSAAQRNRARHHRGLARPTGHAVRRPVGRSERRPHDPRSPQPSSKQRSDAPRSTCDLEVFHRSVFCSMIADGYGWDTLDYLGYDNVMLETDYPHSDSSYPHSAELAAKNLSHRAEPDRVGPHPAGSSRWRSCRCGTRTSPPRRLAGSRARGPSPSHHRDDGSCPGVPPIADVRLREPCEALATVNERGPDRCRRGVRCRQRVR
jgi:hypothetical protein